MVRVYDPSKYSISVISVFTAITLLLGFYRNLVFLTLLESSMGRTLVFIHLSSVMLVMLNMYM